jgi:AraC family transcriptional regulator
MPADGAMDVHPNPAKSRLTKPASRSGRWDWAGDLKLASHQLVFDRLASEPIWPIAATRRRLRQDPDLFDAQAEHMSKPSRSLVPFFDARSRQPVAALNHAVVHQSSKDLPWTGVLVELASHDGWVVDDLQVDAYYAAVNLDSQALVIERKTSTGFRKEVVPPDTLVVHPVGEAFSFRVAQGSRWGGVVLTPGFVESTLGRRLDVPASFGADDAQSLCIVNALIQETLQGGPTGSLYAEHLGAALAIRLAIGHGVERRSSLARLRGGIAPHRLKRIESYIDAHLERSLELGELAALADLSPFHFAREFKAATGKTPHQYVLHRRLDAARRLLCASTDSVGRIAIQCGFSDPSHLVRAFRRRFGVTPGRLRSLSAKESPP